jgi:hypothetical protein
MFPLSIKVGDYLVAGFASNALSTPKLITAVSVSTVNNMKSYAVTAGGVVYTCTAANTTIQEKSANVPSAATTGFVSTWVLGA